MRAFHTLVLCAMGILAMHGVGECKVVRRVVGGKVLKNTWPWLVSMHFLGNHPYQRLQGLKHLCAGTLIKPQWILTAAHCFLKGVFKGLEKPDNWVAVLGEFNRSVDEPSEQRIKVKEIFIGPNMTLDPNFTGDVALLKLEHPAKMTLDVIPLRLDLNRRIGVGTFCRAAGWGQQKEAQEKDPAYGNGTYVPHVIKIKMVSQARCKKVYTGHFALIDRTIMCFTSNRKDTCQGDSGGPLVCEIRKGLKALTGIVSIGQGCAQKEFPGVYTRVARYRRWIKLIIRANKGN